MKRAEAIIEVDAYLYSMDKLGVIETEENSDTFEGIKTLLSTAKQVVKVLGKCKEEIEYFEKGLENEKDEHNRKLKKLALTLYQSMLILLTEEE